MRSTRFVRWSGLAAILSGVVGVVLTPFAATAYFLSGYAAAVPVWFPVLRPLLAPLLTFAAPPAVYAAYGCGFVVVFVLFLIGLLLACFTYIGAGCAQSAHQLTVLGADGLGLVDQPISAALARSTWSTRGACTLRRTDASGQDVHSLPHARGMACSHAGMNEHHYSAPGSPGVLQEPRG